MVTFRAIVIVALQASAFLAAQTSSVPVSQSSQPNAISTQPPSNQNSTETATKQQNSQPGAVPPKPESKNPEPAKADQDKDALEKVLKRMDQTAKGFRSTQAEFVWKMYNSVVNDYAETDTGKIYFRRAGNEVEMAAEINQPASKKVIFSKGKIQVSQPNGQIDVYDASTHREEFEAFLVLGFGSSPEEMRKSFEVKYVGVEKIGDVAAAKLELTPISQKIKDRFPRIDLWIDPQLGLSLRQQLFQPDGDYRLADYSRFRVNQRISDNAFKLKQSANTKTITH
jgi:outer membrane lipoprotein-sorting protein